MPLRLLWKTPWRRPFVSPRHGGVAETVVCFSDEIVRLDDIFDTLGDNGKSDSSFQFSVKVLEMSSNLTISSLKQVTVSGGRCGTFFSKKVRVRQPCVVDEK